MSASSIEPAATDASCAAGAGMRLHNCESPRICPLIRRIYFY